MFKHLMRTKLQTSMTPAQESVKFSMSGPSPLFLGVTAACQAVMDELGDMTGKSEKDARTATMSAISKTKFKDTLSKVIFDNTGIRLAGIIIDTTVQFNAMMSYELLLDKITPQYKVVDKSTTGESLGNFFQAFAMYSATQDDYGKISLPEDMQKAIEFKLYLSDSWFYVKSLLPEETVTAGMIAAVIMHEMGHSVTFYRDFGRMSKYNDITTDMIAYSKTAHTVSETMTFLDDMSKMIAASLDGLEKHVKLKERDENEAYLQKGIAGLKDKLSKLNEVDRDTAAGIRYITMVSTVYILSNAGVCSFFLTEMQESDHTTAVHDERLADEFAVRNGAGAELSAAIAFLFRLFEEHRVKIRFGKLARIPILSGYLSMMTYVAVLTDIDSCVATMGYDPNIKRLEQMCRSAYVILKDPDIPASTRDYYMNQIRQCRGQLDEYENKSYVKSRDKFYNIASSIFKLPFLPLILLLKSTGSQYKYLHEWTDQIIRNDLAYHNARVTKVLENSY